MKARAARRALEQSNQSGGIPIWQRPNQGRIHKRKNGHAGANPKGERHDCRRGEAGVPSQLPQRKLQILKNSFHTGIPPPRGSAPSIASHCRTAASPHSVPPPAPCLRPQTPSPTRHDETPSPRSAHREISRVRRRVAVYAENAASRPHASCSTRPIAAIICWNSESSTPSCFFPAAVSV